ncbi:MAG: hypothetical protein ABFD49_03175 [Armatimonadota bacterium]|nr:hypothetical protein [bacterium]
MAQSEDAKSRAALALLDHMERPRIGIAVREDNLGSISEIDTLSGDGLTRALKDKGFGISPLPDILIVGSARAEILPGIKGLDVKSAVAHFSAKAIWIQTGEVLYAAEPINVPVAGFAGYQDCANRALIKAGEMLINNDKIGFTSHVIAQWVDQVNSGHPITLRCEPVTYDEFFSIKKLVRQTRGCVEILHESFKNGDGELLVKSKLNRSEFRENIAGLHIGKKKICIIISSGSAIEIALK